MTGSVRASISALVGGLLVAALCCAQAVDAEPEPVRKNHPWGRFRPGSWKKVSLITETFDRQGKLINTSVARTRTTLSGVNDDGVTLKVEATVDLAGKQVQSEPQTLLQGWRGDPLDRETTIKELGNDAVTISGTHIPCRVEESDSVTPGGPASHEACGFRTAYLRMCYGAKRPPMITTTTKWSARPRSRSWPSRARSACCGAIARRPNCASYRRIPAGVIRTTLWSSLEVPGGVVAHESEEFDAEGRLARRSKLKLVGYSGEFLPTTLR